MYRLIITPDFEKEMKHLISGDGEIKEKLIKTFKELLTDPDHPALRTHKLASRQNWSISVDMSTRIIFELDGDNVVFTRIGSHDTVYS